MQRINILVSFTFTFLFISISSFSQSVFVFQGVVKEADSSNPVEGATVILNPSGIMSTTDKAGFFRIEYTGNFKGSLHIKKEGYLDMDYEIQPSNVNAATPVVISLPRDAAYNARVQSTGTIPVISIDDESANDGSQEISSLLSASRDPFLSVAGYNLGAFRFKLRGYDAEYNSVFLNGIQMNDPEDGALVFAEWGGLNDVLRNTDANYGLTPVSFSFGGLGSNTMINLRASEQRKTIRASYALSNRSYANRVMATYNTGKMSNGWSLSASASYRWAQEGYSEGTFYKGISYYLGVEKELNKNHSLGLTILGAPTQRGKSNGVVQEVYDLTGNNFYNPNWGYQNGEKRNSRVGTTNKPIGILRHDWTINENISLINLVSFQKGYESNTRLDWYNGRDPRPDYYKYLPSAALDSNAASILTEQWETNSKWNQVDWDYMYEVNRNKNETVFNVDGIEGNNVTGARSYYILQDQRTDNSIFNYSSILKAQIGQRWTINGGLNYQHYNANYYSQVSDLLGGEYFLDIDKFAERDLSSNTAAAQPNLDKPNHVVRKGDRYGFDYDMNVRNYGIWMQHVFVFPYFDYFISGNVGQNENWREGNVRNGRFPDNSLGESEKNKFLEYGVKGGVTYKIDGRNYLTANGGYVSQAPLVNNSFISSRTRNSVVKGLTNERIATIEGSYNYVAPNLKVRLTGYLTNIYDKSTRTAFFNDVDGTFVNFNMTGIEQQNAGVELGSEIKLNPQWKVNAVASIGRYVYANNPSVTISNDNDEEVKRLTVYQKGYRVENCPQEAYSVGLSYNSPKFWFITLNANYARMSFLDMNPYRRTTDIANPELVEPGSPAWYSILHEEEFPAAFTLDIFGGKSWKIKKNYINLNVGINNLLNNTNIISGGYEQARVYYKLNSTSDSGPIDVSKFPPKYFYAYGINYFISLTFRI